MSTTVQVDSSLVSWFLGILGSLVLLLLGIGFKDIREKMKKIDVLCMRLTALERDLRWMRRALEIEEEHNDLEKD